MLIPTPFGCEECPEGCSACYEGNILLFVKNMSENIITKIYLTIIIMNLGEKYDFSLMQTELKNRTH